MAPSSAPPGSPKATTTSTTTTTSDKFEDFRNSHSLWDFVSPSKPWILYNSGSFLGFFDFIPEHYRFGPWNVGVSLVLWLLAYLLVLAATWMTIFAPPEGWMARSQIDDSEYEAFASTPDWYVTVAVFVWMLFVSCNVIFKSPLGMAAWMSFTLWSWTTVTVRHGLLVFAPWVPAFRLPAEILRLPALLSASLTTIIWNFVLGPAILIWFVKDAEQRDNFIGYFTNFRLTQLHVFNVFFAVTNGALIGPTRPLHLGDSAAIVSMMVVYMIWYYCVLDRLGIHLYPIFSPRTPIAIPSLLLIAGSCIGGYQFWKGVLDESVKRKGL
jgi:hypothetical protein